jgi:hypothetical protein
MEKLSKSWFRPKSSVCPEFWFSKPVEFPTVVTRNPLTVWSYEMNHWEAERATYGDGTRQSRSFSLLNLRNFVSSNCCAVQFSFQQFADAQNSVSSKPLARWGCISNQRKAGRVFQLYGIQLRGRILPEQPQNLVFFQHCNLFRIAVFSKPVTVQIVMEPEPLTGWGSSRNRWKPGSVFFLFGIRPLVGFPS